MTLITDKKIEKALIYRNNIWNKNNLIPTWVNLKTVDLDRFFTRKDVAEKCLNSLISILNLKKEKISNYKFIEPSAGDGAFFNLLPKKKRIGIDLVPSSNEIIQKDFLSWQPKKNGHHYITIGNPPFGYRAWLALSFLNHAAKFSEYVGFILPMYFQSEGKGSSKHRVKGLELIHSEVLPQDSFIDPNGKVIKINALWQIWKRGTNKIKKQKECSNWIDLFTVDYRKERLCGQKRIHEADFFLQRTFFKEQPKLVKSFSEVKYVCGYGLVFKKEKRKILKILNNTDWSKYSNLAAHNCRHISMEHIKKTITDAGFAD